ncbi:MAG: FAD-dependent oxidoreductase, partial [Sphingopyxis sp.]|nr:FAD-dependent oxidoreductase [Sphingopyxis sp.]
SEHLPEPETVANPKHVVIAGAGPAGLQAAYDAARRGHNVTLLEKSGVPGGHVTLQAKLPGLEDRSDIIRWLLLQINKLGVDLRLNTEATPELIAEFGADAVIIATGARYTTNGVSKNQLQGVMGAELGHVLTPEDILFDNARTGKRVVVYDNTAYEVGPGIAELLADQGKEVFLVTIDSGIAMSVSELGVNKVLAKRVLPKVSFHPLTAIERIDPANVKLVHTATGEETLLEDIDNVIMITSKPPQDALFHDLQGYDLELQIIGDAREARWSVFATDEAIKDGRRAAMSL